MLQPAHAGIQASSQDLVGSFDRRHRDDGYVVVRPRFLPEVGTYVVLGLAYVCIIGALYVDFSKIRKVRRAYQEEMMSKKTKEMRAAEKQQKAAQRAAKQKVEELRPWRRRLRSAACSATGSACRRSRSRADGGENFRQGFDEVRWGPWFLVSTWRRSPASTGRRSS